MPYGVIYQITNSINGKVYIGQTTRTLFKRWQEHKRSRNNMPICRAIRKYGADTFLIEEIDTAATADELNAKEIQQIQKYNSVALGYNIMIGGTQSSGFLGHRHTEGARTKISKGMRGRKNQFSDKSHCSKGHEYTEENTYLNGGRRHCRECARVRERKRQGKTLEKVRASTFDPIVHGTRKGYYRERNQKIPTCELCRAAAREYNKGHK